MGPIVHSGWAVAPTRRLVVELAVYLGTHRARPVPAERLRTSLWPYDPTKGDVELARVHELVSRLRRCIGADLLPEPAGGYQLSGTVRCDWSRFEALSEAARAVAGAGAVPFLREALGLVRGQPLQDVAAKAYNWAWDEGLVPHMEAELTKAAHTMASLCLAEGNTADASWAARQGLLAVPKDEGLLEDTLLAGAAEGRAALDRAWKTVEVALGPGAEDSALYATYIRLREGGSS
jgi:two-component SAPR family response regulator